MPLPFALQDYENIQAGAYPLPWDMTSLSHRQYSPLWQLGRTALFMQNAVNTLTRRLAQKPDEVKRRRLHLTAFVCAVYLPAISFAGYWLRYASWTCSGTLLQALQCIVCEARWFPFWLFTPVPQMCISYVASCPACAGIQPMQPSDMIPVA